MLGGAGSVKTLPKIGISVLGISMGCAVMWNMRPKGDGYIPVERI